MAAKLLVLAAIVAVANAGLLSLGYGGGNSGQGGGSLGGGGSGANYYNNAPLGLNHGPLPQSQSVVAPLRYAPGPSPPLATTTSIRHQISRSYPAQLSIYGAYGSNGGGTLGGTLGGNLGNLGGGYGGYGGNLGGQGGNIGIGGGLGNYGGLGGQGGQGQGNQGQGGYGQY